MSTSTPAARHHQVRLFVVSLVTLVVPVTPVVLGVNVSSAKPASPPSAASPASADRVPAERVPAQRYLTAVLNKKYVRKGKKVTIRGLVNAPGVPACAAGVTLVVQRSTRAAIYKVVGTTTSDATGAYVVKAVVKKKSRFRIVAPGTEACVEAQSPPRTVKLKPVRR